MVQRAATTFCFAVSFLQMALCQDVPRQRGLQCFKCNFGQSCSKFASLVTCDVGERCSTIKALSDYKVHDSILAKGCMVAANCSSQGSLAHQSNPFRATTSCCNSNYCNRELSGAPPVLLTQRLFLFMTTFLAILSATVS